MAGRLQIHHTDAVAYVRIAHGAENLLDGAACDELTGLLTMPPADTHVLRLSASGPAFCLGREREAQTVADLRGEVRRLIALNKALRESTLVTIAEVQGHAAGFGVGLAALCDVAIAAPSATFCFPEVGINLAPVVVLAWLPQLVGVKAAFDLTATGRVIDAPDAQRLGLLTQVVPSDDLLTAVTDQYIQTVRVFSPRVHREIKTFLRASAGMTEATTYELAADRLVLGSLARVQREQG